MKLFYFDTETTNTNPYTGGIHQLGFIIEIDGEVKERQLFHIRPPANAVIDDRALAVSKVTRQDLEGYPSFDKVYVDLISILDTYINKFDKEDKFTMVGYNSQSFDSTWLRQFFVSNGDKFFGSYFHQTTIDVMILAGYILAKEKLSMPNFQLSTIYRKLIGDIDDSILHNALADTIVTYDVFKVIDKRLESISFSPTGFAKVSEGLTGSEKDMNHNQPSNTIVFEEPVVTDTIEEAKLIDDLDPKPTGAFKVPQSKVFKSIRNANPITNPSNDVDDLPF